MDEQALRGLAPQADSRSHQRAIAYFEQLKSSPDGWQLCTQTLAQGSCSDNNVKFFCFQVLEHKIRRGYEQLGRECRHVLRQSLLSWLQAQTSRPEAEPTFIRNKATQVMALLFVAEFPEVGPSLLDDVLRVVGLCPAGVDLYLRLLLAIDGEVVDRDVLHTAQFDLAMQDMKRNTTVKDGMRERSVPRLVESWLQILYTFQASNAELACLCLEVVGAYVAWIDINLIANERFISLLLGHMSVDVLRESACDCLLEIVSKGMEPRDKMELVESLSQVLEAAGFYNLQQNEDGDFLAHFSKLLCAMGQALLQSWARFGKAGAAPEAAQALDAARAKLPVMLGLLGHSDDDISLNCCGFCYDYLHTLKQIPDASDIQKDDVEAILLAIIKKLTYDEDFNFENEGEEEVMFLDYRKQLKLLLDKVAQVSPNLLLLSIHRVVTSTLRDWKGCEFGEVELALRLLYMLGEALPAGHCGHFSGDESKASVLQDMMVLSGVSHFQHCAVTLQFFETVVRYDKFFSAEPQHIPEVLVGFLDCRGLRHPNAKVRSRCSYLLSRFVKSLSKQIVPFVEDILCQVQDLLVFSPRVNGLQPALSGEDQLFLYEMVGYLVACGELAVGRKAELLGSLLGSLTAAFPPLLARLSAETDEDHQVALAESLAHAVSFVSRTSKAFSSRATVRECGCADVYVACLGAFLPAFACPLQRDSIRAALRSFLHRMLVCLDAELLPYLPAALQAMLSRGDTRDVLDAIPLLNQLVGKFKVFALGVMLEWSPRGQVQVQPLVREVFPVVLAGISGGLRLPVEENDQSAALEKQSIRRAYYTFMLALLTNGLGSIISEQGAMEAEQVLGSVVQGAVEFPDPVAQKMCFSILSRMIETWGAGDALPVFLDFVYKRVVPACFLAPLKPSFDLMDAQTTMALAECALTLRSVFQQRGPELLLFLRQDYLPSLQITPDVAQEFCQALEHADTKVFKTYMKAFFQRAKS
uniref:exportin-T isoform X2 n=1 Tax=Myxine glutinosa TaxID=7769 RepID=UPI00358FE804